MDSVTQAMLGAAVAATVAPKGLRKRALLTGAILGTLPDLDVVIQYNSDVDNFTHHRGFSHSLFVLSVLPLFLLPLLRRFYRLLSWQRLFLLVWLPLLTHPLLDALTAYGTQLFYPLAVTPTFISSIFIIDPLYSLWLIVGVFMYGLTPRWRWVNTLGLIVSTLYLGLGIGLQQIAKNQLLQAHPNTSKEDWFVGALTASPLCWRGVYKGTDYYLETAFNIINPSAGIVQRYPILAASAYPDSAHWRRLQWFNPNTVLRQRGGKLISSDLRMGEFGTYIFEFIISNDSQSGKRLPMTDKSIWQPEQENNAAENDQIRNQGISFPKQKWTQFLRCLGTKV